MKEPFAVAVGNKPSRADEVAARELAARYALPFAPRRHKESLRPLLERFEAVFVYADNGLSLWGQEGDPLRWTPGMALLRLKRYAAGARDDLLLRHADLRPGDVVLDATLGMGNDALMMARAVGPSGRVLGLEKSLAVHLLTSEGLAAFTQKTPEARECAPLQTRLSDSADFLNAAPDKSVDVILFDPMFERPRRASPTFELLRTYVDRSELTQGMVERARRVARRHVLVKASRYSADLRKLDVLPLPAPRHASVVWARIACDG